jgi:hypothetical protein
VLLARRRLQTDGFSASAQTAIGPRPAEGVPNHVGKRFTSAIGLTRVENGRYRRRREAHEAHRAAANRAE